MKSLSKIAIASGLTTVVVAAFALAPAVKADSPADIAGGNIYRIKNVTQNVDYANPASANACDEVEYSVQLHNTNYGTATNVNVSATLPSTASTSNTSTITATYGGGVLSSVSASATLNLTSAQSVSYVSGSTQLLDVNGKVIETLPDGVTGQGVNIGSLNGSTVEFVNFEAKINCPTPTPPPSTPPTTPTTPAPAAPTSLVNTGPGSVAAIFVAAVLAGSFGYRAYISRRLARQ